MMLQVEQLEPGMEVTRDVMNVNDAILLTAGTQLTPQHLRALKMWGIDAIHVAGADNREGTANNIPPALRDAAQVQVEKRLKFVSAKTPALEAWKEAAIGRAALQLAHPPPEKPQPPPIAAPQASQSLPRPYNQTSDVKTFVQRVQRLPSLPSLYDELVRETHNPDASIEIISNIIRKDQSLASRLLRLANSAFYALPTAIGTLDEAVQLIGLREVQNLVLATSVIKAFDKLPAGLVDVPSFWLHSIACGTASALLAEELHDPLPERLFVGGLLHDIGRLIMFLAAPKESEIILQRSQRDARASVETEREVLGFDHAGVGAELISCWKLPPSLREMVAGHHQPLGAATSAADVFLVHYADFIVSLLDFGSSAEIYVPPLLVPPGCERYLLDEERIGLVVEALENQCEQIFPILTAAPARHD